jgi:CrcB protein
MLSKVLLVAAAGAAGSAARYLISGWAQALGGSRFPWGTLAVNVLGCLAIGLLMYLFQQRQALSETARLVLMVGFLGGFTTFSAFGYETFAMLKDRDLPLALANIAASVGLSLIAVWGGWSVGRGVWG